ncbi:MAG: hypothetical protein JWP55_4444 [Mycobacterium sp.]|nr:hypothetical protein [Mycobacterium sp.]
MHFFVSQWAEGNVPYKAFLVQDTLWRLQISRWRGRRARPLAQPKSSI